MQLVGRNAGHIQAGPGNVLLAERLHQIRMEHSRGMFVHHRRNVPERIHRACFIVHVHHRHQQRIRTHGSPDLVRCDDALFIHRQPLHIIAHGFQPVGSMCCGGMLHIGCDDVSAPAGIGQRIAGNGQRIGFTAAGGKQDFGWLRPDQRGDAPAGFFQQPSGPAACGVQTVGISVQISHQMPIYTSNLWVNRGCRGIVEINHPAVFITAGSFRAISFS